MVVHPMNAPLIASLMRYVSREFVAAHQNVWQHHKSKLKQYGDSVPEKTSSCLKKSGSFLMILPLKQPLK